MEREVVKVSNQVDGFGYPLSNMECGVCKNKMHYVVCGEKIYVGKVYSFEGFKCMRCGHEHIEHVGGGVLGDGKK